MELAKPADAPPRRSFSAARYNVESCPHSRRSGQRKGLAQLGGYNLFVPTSWKADPGQSDQQGACRTVRIGSASPQMPIMAREYGRNACALCALVAARSRPRRCF